MSTKNLTPIPMKPIMSIITITTSTINSPQVNVELWKLQKVKGILISEGGSSSAIVKTTLTTNPKDKGKSILVEPSTEEKKSLLEIKMERKSHVRW